MYLSGWKQIQVLFWWLVVGKIPQAYITIKKRKHENIGFKKAFHQCSFTISDVYIFGCLKIYMGQNIEMNILIFQTLKQNNTDPVSIFCILKIKVSVWQVSQDNLGQFSG